LNLYRLGMYLNPTDDVIVLAVDKKSQTHALSRNQPVLPMGRVIWNA